MYHRTNHANGTRTMRMVQTLPNGCMFETAGAWHIGLLPSMMVMNGDGDDDDSKASIFGKAVSHSCHVCLVSSLTVSFLSSPHVDPHEPLHERGPSCACLRPIMRERGCSQCCPQYFAQLQIWHFCNPVRKAQDRKACAHM